MAAIALCLAVARLETRFSPTFGDGMAFVGRRSRATARAPERKHRWRTIPRGADSCCSAGIVARDGSVSDWETRGSGMVNDGASLGRPVRRHATTRRWFMIPIE